MSKRSATEIIRPTKLSKAADVATPYASIPAGPNARIFQSYVLNFSPRIEVTISLKDLQPEIRLASPDVSLLLSAKDFLEMASMRDSWTSQPIYMDTARMESTDEGGLFFILYPGDLGLFPHILDVPQPAVERLRSKLDFMCNQVRNLQVNQAVFSVMGDCIVKTLKVEYERRRTLQPQSELFDELYQLIQRHVTPSKIVKDFLLMLTEQGLTCPYNYYHVYSTILAQRAYLHSLF